MIKSKMNDDEFVQVLEKAVSGDMNAVYEIIKEYEGLIVKNSIINGRFDEDCKAVIISKIIENIKNYKKLKKL